VLRGEHEGIGRVPLQTQSRSASRIIVRNEPVIWGQQATKCMVILTRGTTRGSSGSDLVFTGTSDARICRDGVGTAFWVVFMNHW
jgi:hypothetical protein